MIIKLLLGRRVHSHFLKILTFALIDYGIILQYNIQILNISQEPYFVGENTCLCRNEQELKSCSLKDEKGLSKIGTYFSFKY